ncbi:M48 family metallopeptidase [Ramlibacter sp. PS3R-8]|uniref:M48 family metallopeptidase n=1 Tax=Ramlibacter sp. PS3R-8 TaxID=3133437 RepID=UPI00309BD7C7
MCELCAAKSPWSGRRAFLLAGGALAAGSVLGQVQVGEASRLRTLVPAEKLEQMATAQYAQLIEQAKAKDALVPESHAQVQRLRAISARLIADAGRWNDRARQWKWEFNLINTPSINAFCMPGGKIAVFAGILEKLKLSDDEVAMVLGHEMAHALREHARERIAKSQGTGALLSLGASLFGLGELGHAAASVGTQLLTLKFGRDDEIEADLIGLDLGARTGFDPKSSVTLWQKMAKAAGGKGGPAFLSTHPSGPDRIKRLQANIPRVEGLYQQAVARR